MSSILEALRELEDRRSPSAPPRVTAPAEAPSNVNRGVEMIGIIAIGLLIGAVAVVLLVWGWDLARAVTARREQPAAAPVAQAKTTPAGPSWLATADPPRARVGGSAAPATPPDRPAPARRGAGTSAPAQVAVVGIEYSPDASRRVATISLNGGDPIRLRERESARGVEVQLIERDGVYVQRAGEIFRLSPGG